MYVKFPRRRPLILVSRMICFPLAVCMNVWCVYVYVCKISSALWSDSCESDDLFLACSECIVYVCVYVCICMACTRICINMHRSASSSYSCVSYDLFLACYECMCVYMYLHVVCTYICINMHYSRFMCVGRSVCCLMGRCLRVLLSACMCMFVLWLCLHVCVYVCIYMYIYI
jgi:hypothetical protein